MPRVAEFAGIAIYVYFGDHNPPHFHARAAGLEARIVIGTNAVLTNNLRAAQLSAVLEWASGHQAELRAAWAACNP